MKSEAEIKKALAELKTEIKAREQEQQDTLAKKDKTDSDIVLHQGRNITLGKRLARQAALEWVLEN